MKAEGVASCEVREVEFVRAADFANAQKSYDCTKKLQMHEIVANATKSCKCNKKLQINKKTL
jgi:hypothetical protein